MKGDSSMRLTGRKRWGGVRFAVVVALVSLGFGGIAFSKEKAGPDTGGDVKGNLPGGQTSKSVAVPVARTTAGPVGLDKRVGVNPIETVVLQPIDRDMLKARDAIAKSDGLPLQFAEPLPVGLKVLENAEWVSLPEGMALWRVRIVAPGALGLNFGMKNVFLPSGAKLYIYSEESRDVQGPFTSAHNKSHRELWTPIVPGESAVIEVTVPEDRKSELSLEIAVANASYLDFYDLQEKQASCNIDVVCPQADPWRNEIRSVGMYTVIGMRVCSGTLVMNQKQDFKNYFLTANHCGITENNAKSVVVYWKFESPTCGQLGGGSLEDNQVGATFRAKFEDSDFCLIELDKNPNPLLNVHYAGWQADGAAPSQSVGIHHPNGSEKAICFDNTPLQSTAWGDYEVDAAANHWRVVAWDLGITEPGSSGSGLWDASTHRLVGQLHGGFSTCSYPGDDWYGKLSSSWTGGGTPATRLSYWLDPDNSGIPAIDGKDPSTDDNYEENDTRGTAFDFTTERTWLSSIAGQGIEADDNDWYEIRVSPGYERVIVDCRFIHADGDIEIELYGAFGMMPISGSWGSADNELINFVVPGAGLYYVKVRTFGAPRGNAYDLWWDDLPVAAPAQPDLIVQSISHTPPNPEAGDTVTFTVRVKNQGTVADSNPVFNTGFWSSMPSEPDMATAPEDNRDNWGGLAAGATTDLFFSVTAPAAGTYTAWAFVDRYMGHSEVDEDAEDNNAGPMPSGHSWTVGPVPDDNYEENDTLGAAYDLTPNQNTWLSSISGLGVLKDEDWYKLDVPLGYEKVRVGCSFADIDGDIDIYLYDSSGTELDRSWGVSDNEYIEHVVPPGPGSYYIRVVTYGPYQGNTYDLWVAADWSDDSYEENDTLVTAYDLSGWEGWYLSFLMGLGIQKDDDWYKIDVTPGQERVVVECSFTHAEGDIDIYLCDTVGVAIASSTGVSDNERIDFVVPAPGTYYILVTSFGGYMWNAYDMWWDDMPVSTPYHGVAANVPGRVEMENFDEGGNNRSYLDLAGTANGGAYRPGELVDLLPDIRAENKWTVAETVAGEWLNYTINATVSGVYKIQTRVKAAKKGGVFHIELDGVNVSGPMVVPKTSDWNWKKGVLTASGIPISAGQHMIRVVMDSNSPSGTVAVFDCMTFAIPR